MKLIPKKQNGGNMFDPYFLSFKPTTVAMVAPQQQQKAAQSTSAEKKNEDKGKITEQDLFKTLDKLDGLPNEVRAITKQLKSLYTYSQYSMNPQSLATSYANIMSEIKVAQFNKKAYDDVFTEVVKKQGLNEYAITATGHVVVQDKETGKLDMKTVGEYLKHKNKYDALTNSHILNMRAFDSNFTMDTQLLQIASNGIGISEVAKLIKESMSSLGNTDTKIEGYTAKQSQNIIGGIQILEENAQKALASGMTVDGLFKTKVISKDQKVQADAALKYIYSTLPENAKAILQLHANNVENPVAGALEIIGNMILMQEDFTSHYELDYLAELNADGTKRKSKSGDGDDDEDGDESKDVYNTASLLIMGKGQQSMQTINPGSNLAFQVLTTSLPLVNAEGKPIGKNHTLKTITETQYSGILDFDNATMGGAKIKDTYYGSVVINSDKISVLDFPVDSQGNPDLRPGSITKKRQADRLLQQAGINMNDENSIAKNAQKINQILQSVGLDAAYNSQGQIVSGKWKRFAVLNAVADDRALFTQNPEDNRQLLEITDDNHIDQLISIIESENNIKKYKFEKSSWFSGHDSFYQGTVWIPVIENYFSAQSGSGQKMKMKQIQNINEWETQQYVQQNYRKPPTL